MQRARDCHVNINTIGFGVRQDGLLSRVGQAIGLRDGYDEGLLRRIAAATHRGRFVPVSSLRELTRTLTGGSGRGPGVGAQRRPETTVLVIDLSGSMNEPMEGTTKVHVVEEACLRLLHYKQQMFS